ncbi:unnamed protein product [Vicia faba]|uniref:Uncharacterized protein n=1 Tax=Vicia faba TaxID=3906 RepID=A0AAV0ZL81_VICFA|nr:unnamed protein product [Vicia faba]
MVITSISTKEIDKDISRVFITLEILEVASVFSHDDAFAQANSVEEVHTNPLASGHGIRDRKEENLCEYAMQNLWKEIQNVDPSVEIVNTLSVRGVSTSDTLGGIPFGLVVGHILINSSNSSSGKRGKVKLHCRVIIGLNDDPLRKHLHHKSTSYRFYVRTNISSVLLEHLEPRTDMEFCTSVSDEDYFDFSGPSDKARQRKLEKLAYQEIQGVSNLFLVIEAVLEPFGYLGPLVEKVKQLVKGTTEKGDALEEVIQSLELSRKMIKELDKSLKESQKNQKKAEADLTAMYGENLSLCKGLLKSLKDGFSVVQDAFENYMK